MFESVCINGDECWIVSLRTIHIYKKDMGMWLLSQTIQREPDELNATQGLRTEAELGQLVEGSLREPPPAERRAPAPGMERFANLETTQRASDGWNRGTPWDPEGD